MIKYKIESGGLKCIIKTSYPAEVKSLAIMAIDRNPQVKSFGLLMEIRGGEYVEDNVGYVGTETILKEMGSMR